MDDQDGHAGELETSCMLAIDPSLVHADRATAQVGFELARLGARGCLGKPFDMEDLRSALKNMLAEPPDLAALLGGEHGP